MKFKWLLSSCSLPRSFHWLRQEARGRRSVYERVIHAATVSIAGSERRPGHEKNSSAHSCDKKKTQESGIATVALYLAFRSTRVTLLGCRGWGVASGSFTPDGNKVLNRQKCCWGCWKNRTKGRFPFLVFTPSPWLLELSHKRWWLKSTPMIWYSPLTTHYFSCWCITCVGYRQPFVICQYMGLENKTACRTVMEQVTLAR